MHAVYGGVYVLLTGKVCRFMGRNVHAFKGTVVALKSLQTVTIGRVNDMVERIV